MFSNPLGRIYRLGWAGRGVAKTFRVLRYDKRGMGNRPRRLGLTHRNVGRDEIALLDSLKIDKADYCGLSIGGQTGCGWE